MSDTDLKNAAIALKTTGAGGIDTLWQVCTQLQRERDVSCGTNVCMKMFKHIKGTGSICVLLSRMGFIGRCVYTTCFLDFYPVNIQYHHVYTNIYTIYRNTFTVTFLTLAAFFRTTCFVTRCPQNFKKKGKKKNKLKSTFKDYKQKNCMKHKK